MERIKSLFKNQTTYIVLLLIVTGVFFYLRSVNRNLYGDEITYFYVFSENRAFSCDSNLKEVKTISDLVESQINHYKVVNGRTIMHTIEQLFSGIVGTDLFFVLNTFVFILTIYLLVKMLFNNVHTFKYWLFVIVVLLYLFPLPASLWVSINFSVNYLWPLCLTLLVLYCWNKLQNRSSMSKVFYVLMPILGFVAGWSHESFAIPLSGVIFIYYCFNYKAFSKEVALLVIPLWIGTAFLVFAPGNFFRLQNETVKDVRILRYIIHNLFAIKFLPMMIVLVLFLWKRRKLKVLEFVKDNYLWIGLFAISLLFVLVLGLIPGRTYIAVELYSFILIVKLIQKVKIIETWTLLSTKTLSIIVALLFVAHQCFICNASIIEKSRQDKFLDQYKKSSDGVAVYDYADYGCLINPFVRRFQLEIGDNPDKKYFKETLELYHTRRTKKLITVTSNDYELISNFDKMSKEKARFSGPFYATEGCEYVWALADSVKGESFEFVYTPVGFSDNVPLLMKIKRYLKPEIYPVTGPVEEINEVIFNSRKFLAIRITPMRDVVDIKPVCSK